MKAFVVVALVFLVAVVSSSPPVTDREKFDDFIVRYQREYTPEEYADRFPVFQRNLRIAEELDARSPLSKYGITKFMDLSPEEFADRYLIKNFRRREGFERVIHYNAPADFSPEDLPSEYDWSSKGVLTPVYNQRQCGSCWAFSTTENIESMWALANNTLTKLSMQQIVDCDNYDGGCNGGNPPTAYDYVIKAGGLESYADYPYTAENGQCRFEKSKVVASIKNWQWVTKDDNENAMQSFTYSTGPPSICVDASTWQYYQGGVITKGDGCGTSLDHCVQLTGWQTVRDMVVWTVRNSWGVDWGNKGYLMIEKGYDVCGIGQEVTCSIV